MYAATSTGLWTTLALTCAILRQNYTICYFITKHLYLLSAVLVPATYGPITTNWNGKQANHYYKCLHNNTLHPCRWRTPPGFNTLDSAGTETQSTKW